MPQVATQGDTCDHGGAGIDVEGVGINSTVLVNGTPIAISNGSGKGADGECGLWKENDKGHQGDDTHPAGRAPDRGGVPGPAEGSPTVFVGGLPVHRFNDARGCGAETITASPNVWADFVDKIRIEGATVNDPKPSPAAPTLWAYPDMEFYQFSDSSMFYIRKSSAENKEFHLLGSSDFDTWGTTIVPTLEFEEITDEDKFKVPDIDLATRLGPIPKTIDGVPNTEDKFEVNKFFAGNIQAVGFPSFGNAPIDTLGTIQGQGTESTWHDFYNVQHGDDCGETGCAPNSSPTNYPGYGFKVANESGSASMPVKLIIIPKPPKDYFIFY
jgi:uncharacterized Zn-binding protein involved in type VI secretion